MTFGAGLARREAQNGIAARLNCLSDDDAADTLRYLVATKTREIRARKLRGL